MSDFEYASVLVSIVLALGIADILRFLADTFREYGARKIYWVHVVWIAMLLQLHLDFWWQMWSFKSLVTVGPTLGLVLLGPAMLFLATRTLLPEDISGHDSDTDLKALYFRRKTLFFVLLVLLNVWSFTVSPWGTQAASGADLTGLLVIFAFVTILFAACVFSANELLHKIVVSLVVVLEMSEFAFGL